MAAKKGKSVLRAALDDDLIERLKIAAIKLKVHPNALVDAALRAYLNDETNLINNREPK